MKTSTRREFIRKTALSASLLPLFGQSLKAWIPGDECQKLSVHLFSKHLQFLDYKTAGQMAAEMGFAGLDLTVRPNGHVLPESVKTDLPVAVREIRGAGSDCEMISTNVESVHNTLDVDILTTAASLGIRHYRSNWYQYPIDRSMPEALEMYQQQIKELSVLNRKLGIVGSYQNIDGTKVGTSFWEVNTILEKADPRYFGSQYDIRHAMVEGGFSWENGLKLLHPYIKVIVLKDFKWGKIDGRWDTINTPIGEGMVDFDKYFKMLKAYQLMPPVSLHIEYPLGGAEKGNRSISVDRDVVFTAMSRDLQAIQELWRKA